VAEPQWAQPQWGLNDEAYEMLPSQLLSLVRADPVVTVTRSGQSIELRCIALDGHAYQIEGSTNLIHWTKLIDSHYPTNGSFTLTLPVWDWPQFFRAFWVH
jgi:hypothetical protein